MPTRLQYPISIHSLSRNEAQRDYRIKAHRHDYHQWYGVIRGDVETMVDGQAFRLGPGQAVIIPPGIIRAPRCVGKAPVYSNSIFTCHDLDLDGISQRVLDLPERGHDAFDLLIRSFDFSRPGAEHMRLVALISLLFAYKNAYEDHQALSIDSRQLRYAVDAYLRSHLHRRLSRAEVARALSYSESHLARLYRQVSGKSINERLTELRIEQAKRLLHGSTMSVTAIALEVGFQSLSHFIATFSREAGLSPGRFRKQGK